MHFAQDMVREFHRAFSRPAPATLTAYSPEDADLRVRLINEEALEFEQAVAAHDMAEIVDAICDLLYVTYGAAVSLGVDIAPYFDLVHKANMAKLGPDGKPVMRADGKVIKPDGWKPPDIARLLKTQERT